jgi:eukaryotic-like serine/threonine-protein kinase
MGETQRVCPTCGAGYGKDALFCPKDGAPLAFRKPSAAGDPYLGLLVAGQFEINRLVGIGSMGRVYRAHQSGIERAVAIKILHREQTKDPAIVARFQREARVAGALSHPNIVNVLVAGELEREADKTDGEPYIAMEFLDGMSLRSALVAHNGALMQMRALKIVLEISDGMGEAHAHGVVHRDLKPENVMLTTCGADSDFVKVLDFGVARVGHGDSSLATHAGAILGTAVYACPESARGEPVGPAGDVYSIATVLFECLVGRTPFQGAGPVDLLIQHAQAGAPDIRSLPNGRDVPAPIADLIAKNLAKNPSERAPDARVFGRMLVSAVRASGLDVALLVGQATLLGGPARQPKARDDVTAPMPVVPERKALQTLGNPGGRVP